MKAVMLRWFLWVIVVTGTTARQPNILLIVADDLGWNDIGYHGSEIKTPNLDALAESGVKLENYYVQPICSPTRSQLMTGVYQIHTGLQHGVIIPPRPYGLPLKFPTLANALKNNGYSTHMVGKWHLGFYKEDYVPTRRGFDSFLGYLTGAEDYYTHRRCHDLSEFSADKQVCGLDLRDNMAPVRNKNGSYSTHMFVDRVSDIVRHHAEDNPAKPLFLYLPFQSVHAPLEVPAQYMKKYSFIKNAHRRYYAGMVSALDEGIGNITRMLKQHGLYDNTLIVFSTDNGGQVHAGGNNWPLRGNKKTLWEGGIRGVGFVSGPALPRRGDTSHELIHVSDWFPTLVSVAGGNTTGLKLDGQNVWDTIAKGAPSPRKEILINIDPLTAPKGTRMKGSPFDNRKMAALKVGNWKLITGDPGVGEWVPPPHLQFLNQTLQSFEDSRHAAKNIWLFDLLKDPLEKKDVSGVYPDVVMEMLRKLAAYDVTSVPALHPPYDPQCNPELHGGVWGPWR